MPMQGKNHCLYEVNSDSYWLDDIPMSEECEIVTLIG